MLKICSRPTAVGSQWLIAPLKIFNVIIVTLPPFPWSLLAKGLETVGALKALKVIIIIIKNLFERKRFPSKIPCLESCLETG